MGHLREENHHQGCIQYSWEIRPQFGFLLSPSLCQAWTLYQMPAIPSRPARKDIDSNPLWLPPLNILILLVWAGTLDLYA